MSLDSVELVVSFEKYFNIEIDNRDAEKIRSVQELVDYVAGHLNISKHDSRLKTDLFEKIKSSLIQKGIADNSLVLHDKAFAIIKPENKELWVKLSEELALQIPKPNLSNETLAMKMLSYVWQPKYNWKTISFDQFITAICANNRMTLL